MEKPFSIAESNIFRNTIIALIAIVIALGFFKAGEFVGYRKANFSYSWGENYQRNFNGPPGGFILPMHDNNFRNPHGAFGKIISIHLPTFAIQNSTEAEKSIIVTGDTAVRRFRDIVSSTDLKLDDDVVVIGEPDAQGHIRAKLIRLMPANTITVSGTVR